MKKFALLFVLMFGVMIAQVSQEQKDTAPTVSGGKDAKGKGFVGGEKSQSTNIPKYDMTTKSGGYKGMDPYSGPGVSMELPSEPQESDKPAEK